MKRRRAWVWLALLSLLGALSAGGVYYAFFRALEVFPETWLVVRIADYRPLSARANAVDPDRHAMLRLRQALAIAARDPRVAGIKIFLREEGFPAERAEEWAELISTFHGASKRVTLHARNLRLHDWVIASHADHIAMDHLGSIDLRPGRFAAPFLAGRMPGVELSADLLAIPERLMMRQQLMEQSMSAPLLAELNRLHKEWWQALLARASTARKSLAVIEHAREESPISSQRALEDRWIDGVEDETTFLKGNDEESPVHLMDASVYAQVEETADGQPYLPRIAVIELDGLLLEGESLSIPRVGRVHGAEELRRAVDEIIGEPEIRGAILWISSLGGELFACDSISRQITRLKEQIPVVALLGAQATSGAYYVALSCENIFAYPNSLTGEIGSLSGVLHLTEFSRQRSGLRVVGFGELPSGRPSLWDGYSEAERGVLAAQTRRRYEGFLERIRRERIMDPATALSAAASGLVLGTRASQLRLVDSATGWGEAWQRILQLAQVESEQRTTFRVFPSPPKWWESFGAQDPEANAADESTAFSAALERVLGEQEWMAGPYLIWE